VIVGESNVRVSRLRTAQLFEDRQREGLRSCPLIPRFAIRQLIWKKPWKPPLTTADYRQAKLRSNPLLNERFTRNQLLPTLDSQASRNEWP
jgi:hypothetical protein